ncbi:MAG: hypothetical protein LBQ54_10250 [Planctomycetaceae bacterium]|jgi:hypothetical protein|nr:hypothetical protein [Planctomycetaceae bacterium]
MFEIEGNPPEESPAGQLYFQKDALVFEFLESEEPVTFKKSKIPGNVTFYEDCIYLKHPLKNDQILVLFPLTETSEKRYIYQSLRNWVMQLSGKNFEKDAAPYLRFFDLPTKFLIVFQLMLPFLIYYVLFYLNKLLENIPPKLVDMLEVWEKILFFQGAAVHSLILVPLAFFVLVFSHRWALLWVTIMSFVAVFGLGIACIAVPGDVYLAVMPYLVCTLILAFYYIISLNKI